MRRLWINTLLPLVFCALPVAVAAVIFAAVSGTARGQYLDRLRTSPIDWVILGLGGVLFLAQTWLSWRALQWKDARGGFDETVDDWLTHTARGAEWFPLLGLIGTVAAILETFSTFGEGGAKPEAAEIIRKYGPAITATGSGLFMAFLNILPSWIVVAGRKLIQSMAGRPPEQPIDLVSAAAASRRGPQA